MGTTSDKLTYLNGTKQKLKDSINALGGDITSETTFRNYATELDNIYDSLPKTTGEGSNLSLNTLKGRINTEAVKGDTEQEGTPTPSSPQDINVVTGTQEVLVQNKNLFNKDTITESQRIDPSGNKNYDENCDLSDYIKIQPNTTYTRNITASVYECIAFYTSEKVFISRDTAHSTTTSPNNAYYVRLSCYKTNLDTLQFELGSTATSYVEHQEQTKTLHLGDIELAKIGTYQDYLYKSNDKWYKKEYIKKTNNIGSFADGGIGNVFYTTFITDYAISNNIPYSQYYKGVSNVNGASGMESQETNTIGFINQSGSTTPRFYIKDSRYTHTQVSQLNTWLQTHNLTLYYVLATPTYEEITNTTLLEELNELEKMYSYSGQTNISVSGNLPMILDITALKGESE